MSQAIKDAIRLLEINEEVEEIWALASKDREGYISSDLKDAAKEGIRIALERYKPNDDEQPEPEGDDETPATFECECGHDHEEED